jgi:hypothetical protein
MKTTSYQPVSLVITKLSELCFALLEGKKKCEHVARRIGNEQLRKTIINLEQLNVQYARELHSQIQSLGGDFSKLDLDDNGRESSEEVNHKVTNFEKETLNICSKVEYPIIRLYRKILQEPVINNSLKKIIQYQMNGIMCTTLQLKLLSKFLSVQEAPSNK